MPKPILSSRHYLSNANSGKLSELSIFITEYRRVAKIYLDYLWENGISLTTHNKTEGTTKQFNFDTDVRLNVPFKLSNIDIDNILNIKTTLTSRAKKCCMNQVLGVIKSACEKQRKRQYVANQKRRQRKKINKRLRKALRHFKPVKPDISRINPEINPICLSYETINSHFDGWLTLHSFTNEKKAYKINFPIVHHRHSRKLQKNGTMMNSFLLNEKYIDLRWEMNPTENEGTNIEGADQGERTILALSDGQNTPEKDCHGHSLSSILEKMSKKKKGSKAFKKCQDHRKNFINWSINQLDFKKIKQIKLEDVNRLRYKNPTNRKMSHWTYTLIRDKVERRCMLEDVLLTYDSSTYMSQRCHECGLVLKSNRNKKVYSCKNCGWEGDADFNSACNHQQNLPDISGLRRLNLNRKGFFWKSEGLFTLTGEAFAVPLTKKTG